MLKSATPRLDTASTMPITPCFTHASEKPFRSLMRPEPVSQCAMNANSGLCCGERLFDGLARHRLAVRRLDDGHAGRLRVERVGGEFLGGRRLHADGQAVDAGERAVGEGDDLVARQDQRQHDSRGRRSRCRRRRRCRRSWCPTDRAASPWLRACRARRPSACDRRRPSWRSARARGGPYFPGRDRRREFSGISRVGNIFTASSDCSRGGAHVCPGLPQM